MMCAWPVVLLLLLLLGCHASARRKERPPISGVGNADGDPTKASECRFGGESYELEETWHPDLGPPFGVMHCVHCECVPIHKKRRVVGRVRCKNIKSECPKPTCPEPVLLPGRCCKICPGQDDNPDLAISVDLEREEQEKNGRHYATLLTGPGLSAAATGRLYFRKKTLQWSFLSSNQLSDPLQVIFLDSQDNILEEFSPVASELYNRTGKLCGAWPRLPRKYRKFLRSEELRVSVTYPEGVLSGTVNKYYGLSSEMFSGLLEGPAGMGTAIVSVNIATGSLHANILFRGIVKEGEARVGFNLRFRTTQGQETRSVDESVLLEAPVEGLNSLEVRTVLEGIELDALGRGDMMLLLSPANAPDRVLSGSLIPRISCDMMDCVLLPTGTDTGARGMAYMYFNRNGGLQYTIRVPKSEEVATWTVDNGKKTKRSQAVLEGTQEDFANGIITGEVGLKAAQVEELLKEELYLSLYNPEGEPLLRGRLLTHLALPTDMTGQAALLSGNSSISGLVWMSVDSSCRLHYSTRIEGADTDTLESILELEDYPLENLKALPLFPSNRRKLQVCQGKRCSGHVDDLHKLTVARLDSGDAALVVSFRNETLKGDLGHVDTPTACLPTYARNSLEVIPGYLSDLGEEVPADIKQKCYYEGAFYSDGQQWEASHKQCEMCSCQRAKVVCDPMVCPPADCAHPIILQGECCATCGSTNVTGRGCSFGGDDSFHPEGSRWHPYIPPFGFSRCAVCTCQEGDLTVDCIKETCPPLDCPTSESVRPGPLSCCKSCRTPDAAAAVADLVQLDPDKQQADMGQARTGLDILASGGCKWKGNYHENGESWHPIVQPWGEMNCITCICKDGETTCRKKKCPSLSCPLQVKDAAVCCPRCAATRQEELTARQQISQIQRRKQRRLKQLRARAGDV